MKYLRITPPEPKRGSPESRLPKGRTFTALLNHYCVCDPVWDSGSPKNLRPLILSYAATAGAIRPFWANLRVGKEAEIVASVEALQYPRRHGQKVEVGKGCKYSSKTQYVGRPDKSPLVVQTLTLKDVFDVQRAVVDPEDVRFVVLPDKVWLEQQARYHAEALAATPRTPEGVVDWLRREGFPQDAATASGLPQTMAAATFFCLNVERRSHLPFIPEPLFFLLVYLNFLKYGAASLPVDVDAVGPTPWGVHGRLQFKGYGLGASNYAVEHSAACWVTHADARTVMYETVLQYRREYPM